MREQVMPHVPRSDRDRTTLRCGDQAERQSVSQRKKLATASEGSRAAMGSRGPSPAAVLHLAVMWA